MGARRNAIAPVIARPYFNPRAPHGGATSSLPYLCYSHRISIHAPRMGARPPHSGSGRSSCQFQSTRPAWGRDAPCLLQLYHTKDFNPRAPHGGATMRAMRPDADNLISIHAPRMGARRMLSPLWRVPAEFQSTRPAWGRDTTGHPTPRPSYDFNPRAPHGGATYLCVETFHCFAISIHAPRMGARRNASYKNSPVFGFQSTRPAWGRDARFRAARAACGDFNPRAPHGGATMRFFIPLAISEFQSTRPAWGRDPCA